MNTHLTGVQSPSVLHTSCSDSRSQNLTVLIYQHISIIYNIKQEHYHFTALCITKWPDEFYITIYSLFIYWVI